ncbi:MAG TPA: GntR family transcriptional regulator [Chloroflexota bacterium]|nr:GntR family transcriptional regulator [Chloroflexota bacterium]
MLEHFTPETLRPVDLWEFVAAALRKAIITGELGPGVHLQEPLLAQKFGVSRVPVREALAQLAHEGLVRSEPRRGTFVVGFTADDVHEVYDMRRLLEGEAGRLAAQRATAQDIARLQQLVGEMERAVQIGHVERVAAPDIAFHRAIFEIAGRRRLLAAWEPIAGIVSTLLTITNTSYPDMPRAVDGHRRIVRALSEHDPTAFEQELRQHLANGEQVMQQAIRRGAAVAANE